MRFPVTQGLGLVLQFLSPCWALYYHVCLFTFPCAAVRVCTVTSAALLILPNAVPSPLPPAHRLFNSMGFLLPWACLCSSVTSLLIHILCVWGRMLLASPLVSCVWGVLSSKAVISLLFSDTQSCDKQTFGGIVLGPHSSGMEQAKFYCHCQKITRELIYQRWIMHSYTHTHTYIQHIDVYKIKIIKFTFFPPQGKQLC